MDKPRFRRARTTYPKGVVAVYDNGGATVDRYTVLYEPYEARGEWFWPYIGMNCAPFHPQGFGQHGEARQRLVLSDKVINFEDLPEDCQQAVRNDLAG